MTRRWRAAKVPVAGWVPAARAASMRVLRSHRLPFRVRADRCVQALSLLPGHRPGPAGGMPGRGEDAHVDAELGDEDLCGPLVGPGDGIEPGQCVPPGGG